MEFLGILAAVCTTGSFIPQVIEVVKTKNVKSISLLTYIFFVTGTICWTIYGLYIHSLSIILANAITTVLAGIILFYKIKYRDRT